jgi:uncharacterized protein YbcI
VTADSQDICTDLAQALQEFWETYAGIRPAHVRVVADEEIIVVWLEAVLSPAERQMAGTQSGREMLQVFEGYILEQARPQIQKLVEVVAGRESILAEVHLDVAKGSVLGFFQLG